MIYQDRPGIIGRGFPAGINLSATETVAAGVLGFAFALSPALTFVLRQAFLFLFGAASFLELDVDGIWRVVASG